MSLRRLRPGLRGRLMLAVLAGVGAALVVLTVGFNYALSRRLDHDALETLRSHAAAQLAALRVVDGRLTVPEAPDAAALESRTWVFAGRRILERPRTDPRNHRAAIRLARGPRRTADVSGTETRLYVVPVVRDGRRLGAVVTGISLDPYERTRNTALIASLVFAALVLAVVGIASRWLLAGALRPVARMTSQAGEWSETPAARRFALGEPHDELTLLAATLDRLLDRLAAVLRREQRLTAELSHELRTPLASIVAEAQLALRRERSGEQYRSAFEGVLASATRMQRTLDALIAAARAELGTRGTSSDAHSCALAAVEDCAPVAAERGIDLTVQPPPAPVSVAADADLVQRALAPLVENACRYGRHEVRLALARNGRQVRFTVDDDGPGVAEDERERIFEPGGRGAAGSADGGAGLGLALSRRLARAAGGEVTAEPTAGGGRFVASFPAG
jgi:two-component system, OmpR family, sensor kinase